MSQTRVRAHVWALSGGSDISPAATAAAANSASCYPVADGSDQEKSS